jgi:hypothetical protein
MACQCCCKEVETKVNEMNVLNVKWQI